MNDDGIVLETTLPLAWQIEVPCSMMAAEQRRIANLSLLKALATLESSPSSREAEDIPELMRRQLERMESKLDALMILMAGMAVEQAALPPERALWLSEKEIAWEAPPQLLPADGDRICLELYLSPRLPQPIRLIAMAHCTVPGRCTAQFMEPGDELGEWLARTIFRYHRREVHARKQL